MQRVRHPGKKYSSLQPNVIPQLLVLLGRWQSQDAFLHRKKCHEFPNNLIIKNSVSQSTLKVISNRRGRLLELAKPQGSSSLMLPF